MRRCRGGLAAGRGVELSRGVKGRCFLGVNLVSLMLFLCTCLIVLVVTVLTSECGWPGRGVLLSVPAVFKV